MRAIDLVYSLFERKLVTKVFIVSRSFCPAGIRATNFPFISLTPFCAHGGVGCGVVYDEGKRQRTIKPQQQYHHPKRVKLEGGGSSEKINTPRTVCFALPDTSRDVTMSEESNAVTPR